MGGVLWAYGEESENPEETRELLEIRKSSWVQWRDFRFVNSTEHPHTVRGRIWLASREHWTPPKLPFVTSISWGWGDFWHVHLGETQRQTHTDTRCKDHICCLDVCCWRRCWGEDHRIWMRRGRWMKRWNRSIVRAMCQVQITCRDLWREKC